jgi:hypothetical protein
MRTRTDGDDGQRPKRCIAQELSLNGTECTKEKPADEMKMMQPPPNVVMVDAPAWPRARVAAPEGSLVAPRSPLGAQRAPTEWERVGKMHLFQHEARPFHLLCKRGQGTVHHLPLPMRAVVCTRQTQIHKVGHVPAVDCRSCRPCAEGDNSSRDGALCAPISSWPARHQPLHRAFALPAGAVQ